MINFGTVRPGTTLDVFFDTFSGVGASITMTGLAVGDIKIYKDGNTTERASTSGYTLLDTDGIDFDALTGIHGFSINLADNATAGFFTAGSRYWVIVSTITVDGQTLSFVAARFHIGYPGALMDTTVATLASQTSFTLTAGPAEDNALNGCVLVVHDIASAVQLGLLTVLDYTGSTKTVTAVAGATFTLAAGDNVSVLPPFATGGTEAILYLKQLNIVNSAGSALVASATGGNGHGIAASGHGTGAGLSGIGGATGSGLRGRGGATAGVGIYGEGTGTDAGIEGDAGLTAAGWGGIVGYNPATDGIGLLGLADIGDGIKGESATGGVDIRGDITGNLTGNVSGSVGSVTARVTANTDQINGNASAAVILDRSARSICRFTVGAASTTTSIVTSSIDPAAAVTDQFKSRVVIFDKDTTTSALRGQSADITASTSGGVLTVSTMTTAAVSGDTGVII